MTARELSDSALCGMIHTRDRAYRALVRVQSRENVRERRYVLLEWRLLRDEALRRLCRRLGALRFAMAASYAKGWLYADSSRRKARAINLGILPCDHAVLFFNEHHEIVAVLVSIHRHELFEARRIGLDQIAAEVDRLGLRYAPSLMPSSVYFESAIDFLYIVRCRDAA